MKYFIGRGEQEFGPYSLEEIRRYVGTGNIAPSDLAREEGGASWTPVHALPTEELPAITLAASSALAAKAPNLHWIIVLILSVFCGFLFALPWALVQAWWAKRADPFCRAWRNYLIGMGLWVGAFVISLAMEHERGQASGLVFLLMLLAGSILFLMGRFEIKRTIEQVYSELGAPQEINGGLTLFFGEIHLQYHLSAIRKLQELPPIMPANSDSVTPS